MRTQTPDQDHSQPGGTPGEPPDEITAELTTHYWHAYDQRMATTGFLAIAREFPSLVRQSLKLGAEANRRDLIVTVVLNLASGVFTGYALLATTSVLQALLAAGPTPHRVKAAIPSLALVAGAIAIRSALQAGAGWAENRLTPEVNQVVELRLFDLTSQVELAAFDDAAFHDAMRRARDRGLFSAPQVVTNVINCLTGAVGIVSAAVVLTVLNPLLLLLLLVAEFPGGWAAVRTARIEYMTDFALADTRRRRWLLTDLMADRHTAAELRSFTLRPFLLTRVRRLTGYERDASLLAARRQAITTIIANAVGGVATAAVYVVLGTLLATGVLPLAVAGTAVLAIRTAQAALATLLFSVNQCYSSGLYFSDFLAFCADAAARVPAPAITQAPPTFQRITASGITFSYPGVDHPALTDVTVEIGRGEVVALVGENGSGKTTLSKILAGLYHPSAGAVCWDGEPVAAMEPELLRERIAVIAQDHANWPLSVRHNIVMGRPADPGLLASAVTSADAGPVIDGLAHGYDTLLARQFKDGAELSGGQWQRIAVARGYYRTAPLLIMDEPTAALDARAEYALFDSLRRQAEGRSILIITHRLASARHADRIYVLHQGRVIEQGRHADLLAQAGQYADLYTLQASQYDPA